MPPAAMSIGCTCLRTICSTSASSARAAVAAGIVAAASTAAAVTVAAITRIVPSRRLRARARDDIAPAFTTPLQFYRTGGGRRVNSRSCGCGDHSAPFVPAKAGTQILDSRLRGNERRRGTRARCARPTYAVRSLPRLRGRGGEGAGAGLGGSAHNRGAAPPPLAGGGGGGGELAPTCLVACPLPVPPP